MDLKVKIAANTLVQIIGKIITAGVTFIITILVARHYGVEGFGEFTKIITYVSLFYLIVDFGMNAVFLREEAREQKTDNKKQITDFDRNAQAGNFVNPSIHSGLTLSKVEWVNLLSLRLVWALILIFLALAILVFLPYNPLTLQGFTPLSKLGIIILAPTILTQAIFVSANALFQKNLRYDKSVLAALIGSFCTLLFIFIFTQIKASLLFVIVSYVIGGIIMALLALFFVKSLTKRVGYFITDRLSSKLLFGKSLFLKSLPLGLVLVFNLIYFRADILILTVFRSTQEVGIYGLATKFFELPLAVPTFFMNAVYPVLLKQWNNLPRRRAGGTMGQFNSVIKKSTLFLLLSSLVLAVSSLLLAPFLVLIKQDFAASVLPFRILSLSLPLFFLSSLFMWTLIAQGKQWLLVRIYGFGMIFNILLNLFFIPRAGYNAAAVITVFSEALVLLLLYRENLQSNLQGLS